MNPIRIFRIVMIIALPAAALYWFRPSPMEQASARSSAIDFAQAAAMLPSSPGPTTMTSLQLGDKPVPFSFAEMEKTVLKDSDTADIPPPEFPAEIEKLAGKRVSLKGFMVPFQSLDDMHSFILMSRQVGCFFCEMPKPTQVALVRQKSSGDDKLPFIDGPIAIEGTLKLWKAKSPDDPDLESFLYVIDDAEVSKIEVPAMAQIQ